MDNILITGGAGFIGSNLALALLLRGYKIRVVDNLSRQIHGKNPETSTLCRSIYGKVDFIRDDVRNQAIWERALDNIDVVVHFAAETGTGQSMYDIQKYIDVNASGTAVLLDYIANRKHTVKKIIVASSRAIYGEGKYFCKNHGVVYPFARNQRDMDANDFEVKCPLCNTVVFMLPTDELSKINPVSVYGITKQMQEQLILTCCNSLKIPALALRFQNVYGPGQSLKNPYTGILSIFSTILLNHGSINIFEDGMESRDFIYIDDVVNATVAGIETNINEWLSINVGTGIPTSVLSVAKSLKKLYNSNGEINISGHYRIGDIRHNTADITLLKEKLKYRPNVLFEEGIERFSTWVKEQRFDNSTGLYEDSIRQMEEKGLYK
ncbi:nucleoside-diphosphate-sugar epimerase [Spirochaetia bacterium]|nr:nucleoside-diphosphate-sugar epimerase [Spirochaetia bacterium]